MILRASGRRMPGVLFLILGLLLLLVVAWPTQAPAVSDPSFPDVPITNPFHDAIVRLASEGIIHGYTDGNFGPQDPVLRQQFAKMTCGTLGLQVDESLATTFKDMLDDDPASLYPHDYIAAAANASIIQGYVDGTFGPYNFITRAQVISMVVRGLGSEYAQLLDTPSAGFVPTWNVSALAPHGDNAAVAEFNGLLDRLDIANLDPWGIMPRQEVAQVLANALALIANSQTPNPPTQQPGKDLLHFWWTPSGDWQVFNVSQHTGMRVGLGRPAAWADAKGNNHIAAITQLVENGPRHLVHFWAPALSPNDWQVEDVTALLGSQAMEFASIQAQWSVPGHRDHLIVRRLPSGTVDMIRVAGGPVEGTWIQQHVSDESAMSAVGWTEPPPLSTNRVVMFTERNQLLHVWGGETGTWGQDLIATAPEIWASNGLVHWPGAAIIVPGGGSYEPVIGAVGGSDRHLHTATGTSFTSWLISDVTDYWAQWTPALSLHMDFDLTLMTGQVPYVVAGYQQPDGKIAPLVYGLGATSRSRTNVLSFIDPQNQPDLLWGFDSYLTPGLVGTSDLHIVAVDKQGRLILFWKNETESGWRLVDVSAIASATVGPYTDSWVTGAGSADQIDHIVALSR